MKNSLGTSAISWIKSDMIVEFGEVKEGGRESNKGWIDREERVLDRLLKEVVSKGRKLWWEVDQALDDECDEMKG